jgi:hypothetical protein
MARVLSRAAAAAVSAPAQHAFPAAGNGSNAQPAAGNGSAVPKGRGAKEASGMRSSSLAGRLSTEIPHPDRAERGKLGGQAEESVKAVKGREVMKRAGRGLFGAALAGMDSSRGSRPRSAATRLR